MHNIKLIRRHFPNKAGLIITLFALFSCLAAGAGVVLMGWLG